MKVLKKSRIGDSRSGIGQTKGVSAVLRKQCLTELRRRAEYIITERKVLRSVTLAMLMQCEQLDVGSFCSPTGKPSICCATEAWESEQDSNNKSKTISAQIYSSFAIRLEAIAISNKKLLGAPGLTTRNKKLLGAPGIATRSKDTTRAIAIGLETIASRLEMFKTEYRILGGMHSSQLHVCTFSRTFLASRNANVPEGPEGFFRFGAGKNFVAVLAPP